MSTYYKFVVILLIAILCFSCYDKYSRESHRRSTEFEKGLFVETYTVFGSGAFGTDMVNQYLTDSSTFGKYIGTYDEGTEFFYYRVSGDSIIVDKYKSGQNNGQKKIL
jgi:hypothetical protein